MSDSGSSNIQARLQKGLASLLPGKSGAQGKITHLSGGLRDIPSPQTLEGEIVHKDSDGKARIRTERGEIEVQLRDKQNARLNRGDRVEVDLPRGNPPKNAVVRDAPPPQNTQQTAPPPRAEQSQQVQNTQAPPPQSIDEALRRDLVNKASSSEQAARNTQGTPPPSTTASQAPLTENTPVRLLPLSPAQSILPDTVNAPIEQASAAAVKNTSLLQPNALNIATETLKNIAQEALINLPLSNLLSGQGSALQNPVFTSAHKANIPPVLQNLQTLQPQNAAAILPAKAVGSAAPAPVKTIIPHSQKQTVKFLPLEPLPDSFITAQKTGISPHTFSSRPLDGIVKNIVPEGLVFKAASKSQAVLQATDSSAATKPGHHLSDMIGRAALKGEPTLAGKAGSIQAHVTGFTTQHQPILSLTFPGERAERHFVMQFQTSNITTNTRIELMPLTSGQAQGIPSAQGPLQASSMQSAQMPMLSFMSTPEWQTLDETFKTLIQSQNVAQIAASMSRTLPSPEKPSQLAPTVMFFLAAVQAGDVKSWFGERVLDTLRQMDKGDLANRLSQEFGGLQRLGGETLPGDWRPMPIPLLWQDEVHKIMMYYKDNGKGNDGDDEKGEKGTRFVFDISLPRMGNVQLDGYVKEKNLDLIVRTERALSAAMQQEIRRKYSHALDFTGLKGDVGFRSQILDIALSVPTNTDNTISA